MRLFSTSTHPKGPTGFTSFKWDFNQDGQFDDRVGASLLETFDTPGRQVIGLEVSDAHGDRATFYGAFNVGPAPAPVPPATTSTAPSGGGPPPPRPPSRLATLKSPKTLRARKGRFTSESVSPRPHRPARRRSSSC